MSESALFAGRYRVLGPLGTGGSAETFRALDVVDGRELALKMLHASLPPAELRGEFRHLRALSHPNVMRVLGFGRGTLAGRTAPFYVAELVSGVSLDAALAARCTTQALQSIVLGLLAGLSFLHRAGLCHGDLKPENVVVDERGRAVLVDFGCCVPIGSPHILGGTPGYLAPELARGRPVDERSDLYALGVLLTNLRLPDGPLARMAQSCRHEDPAARPSSVLGALAQAGLAADIPSEALGRTTPFVGRAEELAELARISANVERLLPGPRIVWLEAPSGFGASRLLEEIAFAAGDGWQVALHDPAEESFEAFAARALGSSSQGPEALVAAVGQASQHVQMVLVDGAHSADARSSGALELALGATPAGSALLWVVSSVAPPPAALRGARLRHLRLAALGADELAPWAGPLVPPSRLGAFVAHTGGAPRAVERALTALAAGRLSLEQLGVSQSASELGLQAAVAGLGSADLQELVRIALGHGRTAARRLLERGLVSEHAGRLSLTVPSDREAILSLAEPALVRRESLRAAAAIPEHAPAAELAQKLRHLVRAGAEPEATKLLLAAACTADAPRLFADVAGSFATALPVQGLLLLARLERTAGEPKRALRWLARARRAAHGGLRDELRREAAECCLARGQLQRARRYVEAIDRHGPEQVELRVRILTRLGAYQEAATLAALAAEGAPRAIAARLFETEALALSYLGDHTRARDCHGQSVALEPSPTDRARARAAAFAGFLALRAGDPESALRAYEQALALAEHAGLSDLVTNALLNAANARQQLGLLGSAREAFARALRMCEALGRAGSARTVRANLANLALESGAFDEAEAQLSALEAKGEEHEGRAARARYLAELYLYTDRLEHALTTIDLAKGETADPRELRELAVLKVEVLTALGDHTGAEQVLGPTTQAAGEPDLEVRRELARARLLLHTGRGDQAVSVLESAHARAVRSALQGLVPRIEVALADAYDASGSVQLADEQRKRARARWERTALELPLSARDAFWAHPERRATRDLASGSKVDASTRSWQRVIELTRRINAQRTVDDVLSFALDAAIELTRAARGFVLLRGSEPGAYQLKSARQLDPQALAQGPMLWSRGIAERVIDGGEPVITLDAAHDPRFRAQASVHAMGLTAVLCVPIIGAQSVRGALYLDHRYVRARFTEEDATLASALAEQVAVALANAELIAELGQKQRELLRKQRRVEELLAEKEREASELSRELADARTAAGERTRYPQLVGTSAAMERVFALLDRVVESELPVLVQGESGTGKELVARAIHSHGARRAAPFVALNCGALPDQLLESELFGHVRGAFTGADRDHAGLFAAADGGTLFLDEIAELSPALQVKLLRVLSDKRVRPVGGARERAVDVRVLAATHRDLRAAITRGEFREDLFYRLCVVELRVPALRERREDIPAIAQALLARHTHDRGNPKRLAPDAVRALLDHPFPGNVRELENALQRGLALAEGPQIRARDLALDVLAASPGPTRPASSRREHEADEHGKILAALTRERWNVSRAAASLGMPRNTLYRKLARLGIAPEARRTRA